MKSFESAALFEGLHSDGTLSHSEMSRHRYSISWTKSIFRAYDLGMTLSARNRLEGRVAELQLGGVMAHVVVQVGENLIESVITRRSVEEMDLKVGDFVTAVIKSTEVMLQKD